MAKDRILIPPETAAEVLFASDYTCCICRERGRPTQIHHIDEDPANNDFANLAVLCLLCHDGTQVKGGFGRKFNAESVIKYRDDWINRVIDRRNKADQLAALSMAGTASEVPATQEEARLREVPSERALIAYVNTLPAVLAKCYAIARPNWDTGVTLKMHEGNSQVIDVLVQVLVHLASWFPDGHFEGMPPSAYFSRFVSRSAAWHAALAEPHGPGTGGTLAGIVTGNAILSDLEDAVVNVVIGLLEYNEDFDFDKWRSEWEDAKQENASKS